MLKVAVSRQGPLPRLPGVELPTSSELWRRSNSVQLEYLDSIRHPYDLIDWNTKRNGWQLDFTCDDAEPERPIWDTTQLARDRNVNPELLRMMNDAKARAAVKKVLWVKKDLERQMRPPAPARAAGNYAPFDQAPERLKQVVLQRRSAWTHQREQLFAELANGQAAEVLDWLRRANPISPHCSRAPGVRPRCETCQHLLRIMAATGRMPQAQPLFQAAIDTLIEVHSIANADDPDWCFTQTPADHPLWASWRKHNPEREDGLLLKLLDNHQVFKGFQSQVLEAADRLEAMGPWLGQHFALFNELPADKQRRLFNWLANACDRRD